MNYRFLFLALMTGALVFLAACSLIGGAKPSVIITSPPSGSQYHEGDDVAVQSTSGDAAGVVRIELNVDGAVVRNDTPPSPQANFSIIQTWKATPGSHTVTVRAYNAAGISSDPAAINIQVSPSVALNNPSPTATTQSSAPSAPTNTPAPTAQSAPPPTTGASGPPGACTNSAAFVADVTVPDGTVWAAGQAFNKIWRLSNNGTCAWSTGYQFVFISGEAMTSGTVVAAPATAPGATADILVAMTAPTSSGNHAGTWRMRSASGAVFGQSVTVRITVPGAPPPAPPSCSGTAVIASFTAASTTITAGSSTTLNWGAVTGADSVEIDHGIGGVPAPGSTSVSPGSTTTYTMTAHCGSNNTIAQVTITVVPPLPPPAIVVYDFIANANAARWYNNDGTPALAFPGGTGDNLGFVLWVNSPSSKMEDGSTPSRCLETHPKWVTGGTISGTFVSLPPSYIVQASDHLRATFGFLNGAYSGPGTADVNFKVWMRHPSPPNDSQTVHKTYNGSLGSIDWSLAPWAGQTADFVLEVDANNTAASRDWACWVTARITR